MIIVCKKIWKTPYHSKCDYRCTCISIKSQGIGAVRYIQAHFHVYVQTLHCFAKIDISKLISMYLQSLHDSLKGVHSKCCILSYSEKKIYIMWYSK